MKSVTNPWLAAIVLACLLAPAATVAEICPPRPTDPAESDD